MYSRIMGRKAIFERRDMAGAALRLVADRGPQAVTVAALAKELGAPTGSIYHRYSSREELLAELWMDVVENFQNGFVASLAQATDVEGAVRTALFMASWARQHPLESRLLLLHRRQDFVAAEWPADLVSRASALEPQIGAALRAFALRAVGRADADTMARLRYALLDAPFGGIKPYVQARKKLPPLVDDLVATTARAVLESIAEHADLTGRIR
jgi:AcrR family transcriptional regulator